MNSTKTLKKAQEVSWRQVKADKDTGSCQDAAIILLYQHANT